MKPSQLRSTRMVLAAAIVLVAAGSSVQAFDAFPVITDPNADGLGFHGGTNVWADAPFGVDDTADFLVYSWGGTSVGSGAGFSVSISNGENGIDVTWDGADNLDQNDDVPNTEPVNTAIAAANSGGKLQNGNVIRFSTWMRQDPNAPVTAVPQVETVLKAEFWKQALSENFDYNPNQIQPLWGDQIFDVDRHGGQFPTYPVDDKADWVDINNDGQTSYNQPVNASLTTDAWTLVEHVHTVDDSWWLGIDDDTYTVDDVEEIRFTLFVGDWSFGSLGDQSAIWADNILVEVFPDANSVTPNVNPIPVNAPPLRADFDEDGDVDGDDFLRWQGGFPTASGATLASGDADGDGDVDGDDFLVWQGEFPSPGSGGGSGAVPEPASGAIALLVALIGICYFRR